MKRYNSSGFTLIEVILFLAVSGAVIIGAFAVGNNINEQRYKDSVMTFESSLQNLYSDVTNISNVRNSYDLNGYNCGTSAYRGQSNCVILGKYAYIKDNGSDQSIESYDVVGKDIDRSTLAVSNYSNNNDQQVLKDINLVTYSDTKETNSLEWSTKIKILYNDGSLGDSNLSVLIVKSPLSGQIYTFSAAGHQQSPQQLINNYYSSHADKRIICIDPNGLNVPSWQSVTIDAYASNMSAISTKDNPKC